MRPGGQFSPPGKRPDLTLETRNLVNEAYLKLVDQDRVQWRDRAHVFAISGQIMRRILVDHARRHESAKRGARVEKIPLFESDAVHLDQRLELLDLHRALDRFAELDPQAARPRARSTGPLRPARKVYLDGI